ncbi:MAG: Trehalose-6-phosphate synthase [Thermoleophilia bacterium]|nr:Trehalose-6-phosphate synthase [Thermoleophilia bacterium]
MAPRRHRLLVASNRGPVTFTEGDDGEFTAKRGGGGLVTALSALAQLHEVTWVSHALGDGDVAMRDAAGDVAFEEEARGGGTYRLRIVGQPDRTYDGYYLEIANPLLWFIQHRLFGFGWHPSITRSTHAAWRSYRRINERFADALDEELVAADGRDGENPFVMVHDYHLFLVPGMLRERSRAAGRPHPVIQFFLHIPWPDPGAWRALPRAWIKEVCVSLLACEILGFQTTADADAFQRTVRHFLGATVDLRTGTVRYLGKVTRVRTYPISVAVDEFEEHAQSRSVQRLRERIAAMRPPGEDGRLIVRVDRTDPSKNIVRGFEAYRLLLTEHPELHGNVAMFCQLDPSRQDIAEYVDYLAQVKAAAKALNQRFGTEDWTPVHVNLDSNFQAGVAAYLEYDVLFVNPVADGMNLVSKEGPLINERDGVVVLSDQAGSFNELGPYVIPANPFDITQQAEALLEALRMGAPERAERAGALRDQVRARDVTRWMDSQLDDIEAVLADGSSAVLGDTASAP